MSEHYVWVETDNGPRQYYVQAAEPPVEPLEFEGVIGEFSCGPIDLSVEAFPEQPRVELDLSDDAHDDYVCINLDRDHVDQLIIMLQAARKVFDGR